MTDVLGPLDAAFEEVGVDLVGVGRTIGGEIRQVEDDPRAQATRVAALR
jgi:hypothetical protein